MDNQKDVLEGNIIELENCIQLLLPSVDDPFEVYIILCILHIDLSVRSLQSKNLVIMNIRLVLVYLISRDCDLNVLFPKYFNILY